MFAWFCCYGGFLLFHQKKLKSPKKSKVNPYIWMYNTMSCNESKTMDVNCLGTHPSKINKRWIYMNALFSLFPFIFKYFLQYSCYSPPCLPSDCSSPHFQKDVPTPTTTHLFSCFVKGNEMIIGHSVKHSNQSLKHSFSYHGNKMHSYNDKLDSIYVHMSSFIPMSSNVR